MPISIRRTESFVWMVFASPKYDGSAWLSRNCMPLACVTSCIMEQHRHIIAVLKESLARPVRYGIEIGPQAPVLRMPKSHFFFVWFFFSKIIASWRHRANEHHTKFKWSALIAEQVEHIALRFLKRQQWMLLSWFRCTHRDQVAHFSISNWRGTMMRKTTIYPRHHDDDQRHWFSASSNARQHNQDVK